MLKDVEADVEPRAHQTSLVPGLGVAVFGGAAALPKRVYPADERRTENHSSRGSSS